MECWIVSLAVSTNGSTCWLVLLTRTLSHWYLSSSVYHSLGQVWTVPCFSSFPKIRPFLYVSNSYPSVCLTLCSPLPSTSVQAHLLFVFNPLVMSFFCPFSNMSSGLLFQKKPLCHILSHVTHYIERKQYVLFTVCDLTENLSVKGVYHIFCKGDKNIGVEVVFPLYFWAFYNERNYLSKVLYLSSACLWKN